MFLVGVGPCCGVAFATYCTVTSRYHHIGSVCCSQPSAKGLEALAMYEVNGVIYAGSTLMNVGMVSTFDGNYDSYVLWLRRVNGGNLGV